MRAGSGRPETYSCEPQSRKGQDEGNRDTPRDRRSHCHTRLHAHIQKWLGCPGLFQMSVVMATCLLSPGQSREAGRGGRAWQMVHFSAYHAPCFALRMKYNCHTVLFNWGVSLSLMFCFLTQHVQNREKKILVFLFRCSQSLSPIHPQCPSQAWEVGNVP